MQSVLRPATWADRAVLQRALFQAWRWRYQWSEEAFQVHRASAQPDPYVDGFGNRPGDLGVVAEVQDRGGAECWARDGTEFVGAAWCRLLARGDHGQGFVADGVPELAVAVVEEFRGQGLGTALLVQLIDRASSQGHTGLSLHVSADNAPAQQLYRSSGFHVADEGERGLIMYRAIG